MNKRERLKQQRIAYLKSVGYVKGMKVEKPKSFYTSYVDTNPIKLSNDIPSNGFKKSIDDYRWKTNLEESATTIREIESKKLAIAPAYSKGAYQYIVSKQDVETLGKKT